MPTRPTIPRALLLAVPALAILVLLHAALSSTARAPLIPAAPLVAAPDPASDPAPHLSPAFEQLRRAVTEEVASRGVVVVPAAPPDGSDPANSRDSMPLPDGPAPDDDTAAADPGDADPDSTADAAAAAAAAMPPSATTRRDSPYPRNLNRIYDGTWVAVENSIPFASVPLPRVPARLDPTAADAAVRIPAATTDKVAFEKKAGFALLTAENYKSDLGVEVNYVLGEVLMRDGAYRSSRDISMRVMGVYEWQTGTLVFVGDILSDDNPLPRLYSAYHALHLATGDPAEETVPSRTRNFTENQFVEALMAPLTDNRKRHRPARSSSTRKGGVATYCPFATVMQVTKGHFDDVIQPARLSNPLTGVREPEQVAATARDAKEELVEMSGTFSSDVCKTNLNLVLSTLDTETLLGKAVNYTLLVIFVAFTQVLVLIRQMEMTSTQAGASRVSLVTVGLQAVSDSYLCLGHLTMGIAVQALFNAFATAAFFKFIIFSIFEMRYMLMIWKARRPSGFSEGWEAMRRELSMLYSRFYGSLLFGIVLLYQIQSHFRFFIFALYSFWVPQIVLSGLEDHRRPLHPVYIIGMSATRLAIPLYFWSCPKNFLHIQPQRNTAVALVVWVALQALVLLSQQRFGARWFIPKRFLPKKYDYYRSINVSTVMTKNGTSGSELDCVICMLPVSVTSRDRMTTPCDHVFHDECLQQWMDIKMECPTCRRLLPIY